MELLGFISNYSDVGAGAILVGVVLLILTGRLIPIGTHKQLLQQANDSKDEWKEAHRVSEVARGRGEEQRSALIAGVRIADKFYKDFLPPIPDEQTIPHLGVTDVRS
jgi:hypothetical protein